MSTEMISAYVNNELQKFRNEQYQLIENLKNQLGISKEIDDAADKTFNAKNIDSILFDCAKVIVQTQSGLTSMLQRRFNLGYNRAGRIMDQLEALRIVGPASGSKPRDVYFKNENDLNDFLNTLDTGQIQNSKISPINLNQFPITFYDENKQEIDKLINQGKEKIRFEAEMQIKQLQDYKLSIENAKKAKIKKSILAKEEHKELYKNVYNELVNDGQISIAINENERRREPIPQDVQDRVWNRDGGKCVKCGSQENLEFDHIIPFSRGGANTYRNLQILCESCNIEKSNKIG